ncbi:hypothetical protein [Cellulophaga fucicola]|uniref:hypothetical protein n=1 Tax=Cellulophaga fucicola TaxID=76595 RepID=UPI003EBE3BE6
MNKSSRFPNKIEQSIIERCARTIRILHIESFIFAILLNIIFWYLTYLSFYENFFLGVLLLFFDIVLAFYTLAIWITIKDAKVKPTYLINSEKGQWKILLKGTNARDMEYSSEVDGKRITLITPDMITIPKKGETVNIEYEYVAIFNSPPLYGYNNIFISINNNKFTEKHKTYINKLKPLGLLSIILSIAFCVLFTFCVIIEFKDSSFSYASLALSFIFIRTVVVLIHNKQLTSNLMKKK